MPKFKRNRDAFPPNFDGLTAAGANTLCGCIEFYWLRQGYAVKATRYALPGIPGAWGVRTDMVAGMPRICSGSYAVRATFADVAG